MRIRVQPQGQGPRNSLFQLFVQRAKIVLAKAPRERPDLLLITVSIGLIVLVLYAIAFYVGLR